MPTLLKSTAIQSIKPTARRVLRDERRPLLYALGRQALRVQRYRHRIRDYSRPQYRDSMVHGAKLASSLGYKRMTAIEFGVATGSGLIALERIATEVEREWPVTVDVVGFDLGTGLPQPTDFRDLPWHWRLGDFPMDVDKLRARLQRAELIIGDLRDTLPRFVSDRSRLSASPVGAVMCDLDFYSSTAAALELFEAEWKTHLPRVQVYFDDLARTNKYIGEWRAIEEFNDRNADRAIAFRFDRLADPVTCQLLEFHHFQHPRYAENPRQTPRYMGRGS